MMKRLLVIGGCVVLVLAGAAQAQTDESEPCALTGSDALGPYYIEDAPATAAIYPATAPGEWVLVTGTVYAADCATPLADVVVEVWQADAAGEYDFSDAFIGRGQVVTDEHGQYAFLTVVPGEYQPRPSHIHYRVSILDPLTEVETVLVTQLYFAGTYSGPLPEGQVTTLDPFDLEAYRATLETSEQATDSAGLVDGAPDEAGQPAIIDTAQLESVLYHAVFDVVLDVPTP